MNALANKLVAGLACLLMASGAQAEPVWGWSFDAPHAGTVMPTEQIDGKITIFNDWLSTETLYVTGAAILWPRSNGNYANYDTRLAADLDFHLEHLRTTGLEAGETYSFTMFSFVPNGRVWAGAYSSRTTLQSATISDVHNLLRWQVAAVPEPASYGMWLAGLGLLALVGRRSR